MYPASAQSEVRVCSAQIEEDTVWNSTLEQELLLPRANQHTLRSSMTVLQQHVQELKGDSTKRVVVITPKICGEYTICKMSLCYYIYFYTKLCGEYLIWGGYDKRDNILQKRPKIGRSLLIVAKPYA